MIGTQLATTVYFGSINIVCKKINVASIKKFLAALVLKKQGHSSCRRDL